MKSTPDKKALASPPETEAQNRLSMYKKELVDRAGLFYRLGYAPSTAISRLKANIEWDFEIGAKRPTGLSDKDIAEIVKSTYSRRPQR